MNKEMVILKGNVTRLIHSTEVSGGEHGSSTSHVATFQLGTSPVRLKMPDSIAIVDGDSVVVAGSTKRGVFNAVAYRNNTNGALGKDSILVYCVFGILFSIFGLVAMVYLNLICIPLLIVGVYLLQQATNLSHAYSAVKNAN